MTPLPNLIASGGRGRIAVWRLERSKYIAEWHSAEGAFRSGGRWSTQGRRVIYASIDPATTILEVAVHKGFHTLDIVPHSLLELDVAVSDVRIVEPSEIANPNWLRPGTVSVNQQKFGDDLFSKHQFVAVPSVVSAHSWNFLIDASVLEMPGTVTLKSHERFALDTRLIPTSSFKMEGVNNDAMKWDEGKVNAADHEPA